ncbi:hypothetical protein KUTeg_002729 [Tegillarca granosa]|uniref:Uncharacterized protein n=1 Tax=Tegillarca granosa TaxID=220873 RepID=A0ABQ9FR32_TEGGR|nr:hypothetical protein KUTeg_002729 [Tegillarca granosa]
MCKSVSTYLGISQSYMSKLSKQVENPQRKTRSDKTSDKTTMRIVNFFNQGDITTNLPDTRRIKNDLQERQVLDRTLHQTFTEFKDKNPETDISFSTFVRSKPENIETTKFRKGDMCLCEVCTNVDLKIRGLSQLAAKSSIDVKVANRYEALKQTLCKKDKDWNRKKCIVRDCQECGVDGIVRFFQPLITGSSCKVSYIKWERKTIRRNGKDVTQIYPQHYLKTPTEVVVELSEELNLLAEHHDAHAVTEFVKLSVAYR